MRRGRVVECLAGMASGKSWTVTLRHRWPGFVAMALWLWAIWLLLSWTATTEQLVYGAVFAVVMAVPLSSLGNVVRPWRVLAPRRLYALVILTAGYLVRLAAANVRLARRIWTPSRPLRSGMVLIDSPVHGDGALSALGLITSTVVDNQLIDVDDTTTPPRMQYHGVWITSSDPERNASTILDRFPDWLHSLERPAGSTEARS